MKYGLLNWSYAVMQVYKVILTIKGTTIFLYESKPSITILTRNALKKIKYIKQSNDYAICSEEVTISRWNWHLFYDGFRKGVYTVAYNLCDSLKKTVNANSWKAWKSGRLIKAMVCSSAMNAEQSARGQEKRKGQARRAGMTGYREKPKAAGQHVKRISWSGHYWLTCLAPWTKHCRKVRLVWREKWKKQPVVREIKKKKMYKKVRG